MSAEPLTMEELSRSGVIAGTRMPFTFDGANLLEPDHISDAVRERREAALREAHEIARTELARRRKQLGGLTPEQELSIEALLISTVSTISELVAAALETHQRLF